MAERSGRGKVEFKARPTTERSGRGKIEFKTDIASDADRRSVASTLWHPMYPISNGTINAQDRMQIVGLYSGILSNEPSGTMPGSIFGAENGETTAIFGGLVIR